MLTTIRTKSLYYTLSNRAEAAKTDEAVMTDSPVANLFSLFSIFP